VYCVALHCVASIDRYIVDRDAGHSLYVVVVVETERNSPWYAIVVVNSSVTVLYVRDERVVLRWVVRGNFASDHWNGMKQSKTKRNRRKQNRQKQQSRSVHYHCSQLSLKLHEGRQVYVDR
jgi:hypothetical protein